MVTHSSPLAATIDRLGLTRDQAARLLGADRSTLQRWLNGFVTVPAPILGLLHMIHEGRNPSRVQELAAFVDPFFAAEIAMLVPKQRKPSGSALTNAERQRRYRDRQKQARVTAA